MTFDQWYFATKSKREPSVPLGTELIYFYCNNDMQKFDDLCDILESAYNAGKLQGENDE
jgi:hypothetical protein